ncbi:hypothetical protein [Natronolimnobius baerhuensis]|uniref:Uncharacterized protein n=1 Tax=Natronolimnobius baerhuensis TaxID=253108 RepID=A0A202E7T7_9EURY|nr:hypothetical protein [Natronolimnobius baerhuensis]OVE84321.1 hypothetical protein B2G88_07855 [Natronolimnobius baerhuensis]
MAAIRSIALGSGTDNNEVDLIDIGALIILPIMASMIFKVFTWQVNVFGNYDFTDPIWTIASANISVALIVTVFSSVWVLATNVANLQTDHSSYEIAVIAVAIALPLGVVFVPAVEALVMWHDLMQVAALLYVSGATVAVSYLG